MNDRPPTPARPGGQRYRTQEVSQRSKPPAKPRPEARSAASPHSHLAPPGPLRRLVRSRSSRWAARRRIRRRLMPSPTPGSARTSRPCTRSSRRPHRRSIRSKRSRGIRRRAGDGDRRRGRARARPQCERRRGDVQRHGLHGSVRRRRGKRLAAARRRGPDQLGASSGVSRARGSRGAWARDHSRRARGPLGVGRLTPGRGACVGANVPARAVRDRDRRRDGLAIQAKAGRSSYALGFPKDALAGTSGLELAFNEQARGPAVGRALRRRGRGSQSARWRPASRLQASP